MTEKEIKEIALFRYKIIAPLVVGTYTGPSMAEFYREAASVPYTLNGNSFNIAPGTIKQWHLHYRKHGFDALYPKTRADSGRARHIGFEASERIKELFDKFPNINGTLIYEKLIQEGYIYKQNVSLPTFLRFIKNNNFRKVIDKKDRKAFQHLYANDCWQADSSVGPYISINGKKTKTWIIMFIDDASRKILCADFYFNDNALNMQKTFKSAITKFGKPKKLYVDNGGSYKNLQLELICASIGTVLINTKAYDPQAKGKVERTFRTIKDGWMNGLDWSLFHDLNSLQASLDGFVMKYNNKLHSSIKMTPNERFFKDKDQIKPLPIEIVQKHFMHTVSRHVRSDSTIKIETLCFEVPHKLIGEHVTIKYFPDDLSKVYVSYQDELIECRILNNEDNSKVKRNVDYSKVGDLSV